MAQQIINIGAAPDDGTGDHLRVSFDKCNQNFTELYDVETGISEAPIDGNIYGRQDAGWTNCSAQFAPLVSPIFTGNPTAPTPIAGDNDTSIATTAFVSNAITALIGTAGSGADTLGELEDQILLTNAAVADRAPIASPIFTGDPKAPTPATADDDTSIATTAYVKANLGSYLTTTAAAAAYQPLDADLTALAALTGTNTIYYRSAANTWAAVNVSTGLAFSGGNLTSTVPAGAPVGAEYITSSADATLTAERVLTDTATVTWDRTTAGQIKANAAGGVGTIATTFDTLRVTAGLWTFSESNLRVTRSAGGGTFYNVCSTPAAADWDLLYFEATIMLVSSNTHVGVCNKNHPVSSGVYPGQDANSMGFQSDGRYFFNNSASGFSYPTFTTGDTLAFAVRLTDGTIWMRNVTTNSFWNADAGADPTAAPPTGGISGHPWMYNAGPLAVVVGTYNTSESVRLNFDGTFLGTVPTGYRRWRAGAP
jgi:SPRY domain